jgi:hypothetical protein
MCEMHDQRRKRTGTTDSPVKSLADRFWSKVDKNGPVLRPELGRCWVWTAATNEHGYGVMRPSGKRSGPTVKAHRVSAELAGMGIDGVKVLHSCDNPPCVNPAHLRVGTMKENSRDSVTRDRHARGSRSGAAKLTESSVIEIRRRASEGELVRKLAVEYGVSPRTVYGVVARTGWRHVA